MKVGDRVEAIKDGANVAIGYGMHTYHKEWLGVIDRVNYTPFGISLNITFDNGKFIPSCSPDNFKVIKEELMNTFKKSDLKTGMMVQLANSEWYLVLTNSEPLTNYDTTLSFWSFYSGFMNGNSYGDNLNGVNILKDFEIVKVASCGNFSSDIINAFVNHSDPTAIPEFHIIWSRESDEKAKVINVIEGCQKKAEGIGMNNDCDDCKYVDLPPEVEPCRSCDSLWNDYENGTDTITSKEIHDKLHVLYSQYNDLGTALQGLDDVDNPYTYELIQARYNALAQEIESISKKEWREA